VTPFLGGQISHNLCPFFYFSFVDFFDGGGLICTSTFPVFPPTFGLLSPDDCRLTLGEDAEDDNIR
jgi:hypothetical protein